MVILVVGNWLLLIVVYNGKMMVNSGIMIDIG